MSLPSFGSGARRAASLLELDSPWFRHRVDAAGTGESLTSVYSPDYPLSLLSASGPAANKLGLTYGAKYIGFRCCAYKGVSDLSAVTIQLTVLTWRNSVDGSLTGDVRWNAAKRVLDMTGQFDGGTLQDRNPFDAVVHASRLYHHMGTVPAAPLNFANTQIIGAAAQAPTFVKLDLLGADYYYVIGIPSDTGIYFNVDTMLIAG